MAMGERKNEIEDKVGREKTRCARVKRCKSPLPTRTSIAAHSYIRIYAHTHTVGADGSPRLLCALSSARESMREKGTQPPERC